MPGKFVRTLLVGTPLVSACSSGDYCGNGHGPQLRTEAWDGGLADGGAANGSVDGATCALFCGGTQVCTIVDSSHLQCTWCNSGRAPPGLRSLSLINSDIGSWLARSAELEGASVYAFDHLAAELETHGLPQQANHARRAATQEVRHAIAMTRLALRAGYCPAKPNVVPTPLRSLEEIALDNAIEGCGRELFGAVVNRHQATHASDAAVREAMAKIALEEDEHARFSMALMETLMPRLTVAQRRRAREAQHAALETHSEEPLPDRVRRALGLMDLEQVAATSRALLDTARI